MLQDHRIDRRELFRIGAVGVLGAAAPGRTYAAPAPTARHCIFMMLQGGPSHIDLWDPKPAAPEEVRGPFQTIETKTPGLRFGEVLPRTAQITDRLCVVRSMEHRFSNHIAGTYIMLTGSTNQPDADREAHADDFPGPGAVVQWLDRRPSAVPPSVSLPTWLSIPGPSNRMPGQYAGFLGAQFDPFLVAGKPESADFRPLRLQAPGEVGDERMRSRVDLVRSLDSAARFAESQATRTRDRFYEAAYQMLTDPRIRQAVDLRREPDKVRDRYGRHRIGQSLLLARRLVEAGVGMVNFNEFNQAWDHHGNVRDTLRARVPPLDQAYAALIVDLEERGLLDSTLVVNTGEFGRTPVLNKDGGRDHWPFAFTTVLAGGGVRKGYVHGASDSKGAYVVDSPVSPADFLATLWHSLGVSPETELRDRLNRPIALSQGTVQTALLG